MGKLWHDQHEYMWQSLILLPLDANAWRCCPLSKQFATVQTSFLFAYNEHRWCPCPISHSHRAHQWAAKGLIITVQVTAWGLRRPDFLICSGWQSTCQVQEAANRSKARWAGEEYVSTTKTNRWGGGGLLTSKLKDNLYQRKVEVCVRVVSCKNNGSW